MFTYIENEGALFRSRGPSVSFPSEIWSHKDKVWMPYEGDVPKPYGWGEEISEAEALAWVVELGGT